MNESRDVDVRGRGTPPRTAALLGLAAVVALAIAAAPAVAGEAPGPWWRGRIEREALAGLRVSGPGGRAVLVGARPDTLGLAFAGLRAGSGDLQEREDRPGRVAWSEIDRVETPVGATGFGALLGGALGTAAAVVWSAAERADHSEHPTALRSAALMAGGGALGGLVGARFVRWKRLYPPLELGIRLGPPRAAR